MFKANKFLAIIVLFFFVVIMGSCGGGGGGGESSPAIEQTASKILETQNSGQQYYTTLASQGDPSTIQKTVDYLKTQPNVTDASVGEDGVSIWVKYDSGVEGIILTKSFESLGGTISSQSKTQNVRVLQLNESPLLTSTANNKKAIILLPVDSVPNYKDESADDIAAYLQQSDYPVEIYRDEAVTVDLMKTLPNYNFVYMATHGGVGLRGVGWNVQIMTGQVANSSTMATLWNYLTAGATSGLTIFRPPEGDKTYFGLNKNFFDDYTYPGTFVYMNACSSLKNDSLADAFLNNGASLYLGWDNISFLKLTNDQNPEFFSEFSKVNNTFIRAYNATIAKYYPATVYKDSNNNGTYHALLSNGQNIGDVNDTTIDYTLNLKYKGNTDYVLNQQQTGDTIPPTTPTNLTATAVSSSQIDLSWNASTDNVGVAGYKIYDYYGTYLKSVNTTSTSITGLNPNTYYCFSVSAYDAAGNESGQSSQACATTSQTSGWSFGSSMPTAREWAASAVVGSSIYVIGGATGSPYTYNDVEAYNTLTDSWTSLPNMPFEDFLIRGAVVNGQIYIFGGSMNSYELVYRYDPSSGNWTRLNDMPYLGWMGEPAVVNSKVYIFGGKDSSGNVVATTLEYDPTTDSWSTKASMPTARYAPATAVYNNKIYVLGGNYGTSKNEVYDPTTNTWETKASVSFNNYGWGVAEAIGGKIYFVDSETDKMGIYSPSTNTWTSEKGLSVPRDYLTGESVNGKLYVIGGQDSDGGKSNVVEIYTPSTVSGLFQQISTQGVTNEENYSDFHYQRHLEAEEAIKSKMTK